MATIRPFRGLRFTPEAGNLADLTAPPYDVVSPSERAVLAAKNPHNTVILTLPEEQEDARSKFVKYARSAAELEAWRRAGILARDEQPSFYRSSQTFNIPGTAQSFTRTKLVALIKVEPYSAGVVLPHEQTFPKHKEDRLRLLEATNTHLEPIFGLFEDESGAIHSLIASSPAEPIGDFVTETDGIRHVFERITDPQAVAALSEALALKKVWIADGHHRYETALNHRQSKGTQESLIAEDFMMIGLCSISDPGLVLLPTHRILKKMPCTGAELKERLTPFFSLTDLPNSELMPLISALEVKGRRAFGVALPGGKGFVAEVKDLAQAGGASEGSERLRQLDVSILHHMIFGEILGLKGTEFFSYTRLVDEALGAVESGSPAAFLMNPPTIDDMRAIAEGGEVMPQKSTYYYPKLLSGLAMWSLKDF
jgi:uncharacterized protein (DUF1015 family)